jgi:hypothetical protein
MVGPARVVARQPEHQSRISSLIKALPPTARCPATGDQQRLRRRAELRAPDAHRGRESCRRSLCLVDANDEEGDGDVLAGEGEDREGVARDQELDAGVVCAPHPQSPARAPGDAVGIGGDAHCGINGDRGLDTRRRPRFLANQLRSQPAPRRRTRTETHLIGSGRVARRSRRSRPRLRGHVRARSRS